MASFSADTLGRSENEVSLGFGFDDVDFSDRILRLEITPLESDTNPATKRKKENPGDRCVSSLKVRTLNICSLILAAKSPFFFKEAAFLDMLNSIYDRPLNATTRAELVDVLMAADKFEVTTCMRQCVELLLSLPITIESSIFYLELPSSVFVAKQHLSAHFRHFDQSKQEEAIEVVLGSDNLEVNLEDDLFNFILKWVRLHYPSLKERRKILTNRLPLEKLKEIEMVTLESAQPHCIVYFNIKKQDCAAMLPTKQIYTEAFCLGGRRFSLLAQHNTLNTVDHFGLFVEMTGSESCRLKFEISVMKEPSNKFQSQSTTDLTLTHTSKALGNFQLFSWTDLMADGSEYFVDGILHLQAQLTIIN
ncbi:hypothetical protein V2J09_020564 [Rumex salicifolius]